MAPNPRAPAFIREERDLDIQWEACEDRGRGWKDAATSQGTLGGYRELEEPLEGVQRVHLDVRLPQRWEGVDSHCFKRPVCGHSSARAPHCPHLAESPWRDGWHPDPLQSRSDKSRAAAERCWVRVAE